MIKIAPFFFIAVLGLATACSGLKKSTSSQSLLIGEKGVDRLELGMSWDEAKKRYTGYNIESQGEWGYSISPKSKPILFIVNSCNDFTTITSISVFSNDYKTDKRIRVGSKVSEVIKAYPGVKLTTDFATGLEFFSVKLNRKAELRFVVQLTNGESVGVYSKGSEVATTFNSQARVAGIELFTDCN